MNAGSGLSGVVSGLPVVAVAIQREGAKKKAPAFRGRLENHCVEARYRLVTVEGAGWNDGADGLRSAAGVVPDEEM